MRVIYVDEAGRGRIDQEPYFIVACAIISLDHHWHELSRHYADLANDIFDLPNDEEDELEQYVFHAKDIWHGSGDFARDRFSLMERMKILKRLAMVPAQYSIPICVAIIDRKTVVEHFPNKHHATAIEHAYAYSIAMQYVDSWMTENCPEEVATVTVEDVDTVKSTINMFHNSAVKLDTYDDFYDRGVFVTKTIVDAVNFAPKERSPLLQIADHCAFIAKRRATGCRHVAEMWSHIKPQVWSENRHARSQIRLELSTDCLSPI